MKDAIDAIRSSIDTMKLPATFDQLFGDAWNAEEMRFTLQETYVLDFKETIPERFSEDYGVGIARLAIGFHNSFGGIIIFGVKDRTLSVTGIEKPFDIETFNSLLGQVSGVNLECRAQTYRVPGTDRDIAVVLVPRRGIRPPVRLIRNLGKYTAGITWLRDRHQVIEATPNFLPLLYSDRQSLPSDSNDSIAFPVHRSLPPSPATMKSFVGREKPMESLWDWLVFDTQPRLYLYGPGGSGKSTLAFEFARIVAESGSQITLAGNKKLDYVIYISGKETEFNPYNAREQAFRFREFSTVSEQFSQIVYHSGLLDYEATTSSKEEDVDILLTELFSNFNGLIVLDDIDALSRRRVDTGEESLLIKAMLSGSKTKLLYTLRFPPTHALRSAYSVPGLEETTEFFEFLEACRQQFSVPMPDATTIPRIQEATSKLPLLIETIVGLRRFTGNYSEALRTFTDRGGDDARRYLYQREYDRLEQSGKSRQVLAALFLLSEPTTFETLANLFPFSRDQISDALNECGSVFLSTYESESGETLYQLTPPSAPFVKLVSENLPYFDALSRQVQHFRAEGAKATPEEAAVIVAMGRLIREAKFEEIAALAEARSKDDPVMVNPQVRSLLGQAYSELGADYRERARECFKFAEGIGYVDPFMMRRWYNMEALSGYGINDAEGICRRVISSEKLNARCKSEFYSKLGHCLQTRADSLWGVSRDKALQLSRQCLIAYMNALWVGRNSKEIDLGQTTSWLERHIEKFIRNVKADEVEQIFLLIEEIAEEKHDIHPAAMSILVRLLSGLIEYPSRAKISGLCTRTSARVNRSVKPVSGYPNFVGIIQTLETIRSKL